MSRISIAEQVRIDLVAECKAIKAGVDSYRNTVKEVYARFRPLDQVTSFPSIAVVLRDGTLDVNDASRTSFKEHLDVAIVGYVSANTTASNADDDLAIASESLLHDLKRMCSRLVLKYLNDPRHRWSIEGKAPIFKLSRVFPDGQVKGMVEIDFKVMILWETFGTQDDSLFIADASRADVDVVGDPSQPNWS